MFGSCSSATGTMGCNTERRGHREKYLAHSRASARHAAVGWRRTPPAEEQLMHAAHDRDPPAGTVTAAEAIVASGPCAWGVAAGPAARRLPSPFVSPLAGAVPRLRHSGQTRAGRGGS